MNVIRFHISKNKNRVIEIMFTKANENTRDSLRQFKSVNELSNFLKLSSIRDCFR